MQYINRDLKSARKPSRWKTWLSKRPRERMRELRIEVDLLKDALAALEHRKNEAYLERNRVIALLARLYPAGIKRTDIDGWHPAWHNCVYIDLPNGQVSWHYHDAHAFLFDRLPPYRKSWDGHTTEEKYQLLAELADVLDMSPPLAEGDL